MVSRAWVGPSTAIYAESASQVNSANGCEIIGTSNEAVPPECRAHGAAPGRALPLPGLGLMKVPILCSRASRGPPGRGQGNAKKDPSRETHLPPRFPGRPARTSTPSFLAPFACGMGVSRSSFEPQFNDETCPPAEKRKRQPVGCLSEGRLECQRQSPEQRAAGRPRGRRRTLTRDR
jgi:hypothetical protein